MEKKKEKTLRNLKSILLDKDYGSDMIGGQVYEEISKLDLRRYLHHLKKE